MSDETYPTAVRLRLGQSHAGRQHALDTIRRGYEEYGFYGSNSMARRIIM